MDEQHLIVDNRRVMVRDTGDRDGEAVLYFHGSPGCRLDVSFGDEVARRMGIRVVSFDRPGFGRSDPSPFSLKSIALDAGLVVDALGLDRFSTLGWSGGGPFALAVAATLGERVVRVGVASGPGPFQQVPGALEQMGEDDRRALSLLPDDPAGAAEAFSVGSELMVSARDDETTLLSGMEALLGGTDAYVFADPVLRHHLFTMISEGLRQGFGGVAWDNVAWVGPWGVDITEVLAPVNLWYGGADPMIAVDHGRWLVDHLPLADLKVFPGEGHLHLFRHWNQILGEFTRPAGADDGLGNSRSGAASECQDCDVVL
ncbi:MAG: alpha/beta hydrolase [Microthrixaceae bacterium]